MFLCPLAAPVPHFGRKGFFLHAIALESAADQELCSHTARQLSSSTCVSLPDTCLRCECRLPLSRPGSGGTLLLLHTRSTVDISAELRTPSLQQLVEFLYKAGAWHPLVISRQLMQTQSLFIPLPLRLCIVKSSPIRYPATTGVLGCPNVWVERGLTLLLCSELGLHAYTETREPLPDHSSCFQQDLGQKASQS